jgi:hypothetical protein
MRTAPSRKSTIRPVSIDPEAPAEAATDYLEPEPAPEAEPEPAAEEAPEPAPAPVDDGSMRRLTLLFTATSLTVLLVTLERFSFTTEILLRPANFLRLHEVVQLVVIILLTVLVQAGLLWAVSHRFSTLSVGPVLLFVAGVYFTATGNGVHELGSATLQTYCEWDTLATASDNLCAGLYVNDFYTGNIMFFAGALMTTTALLWLERRSPLAVGASRGAVVALVVNALVYAVAVVAYAGFDTVLVGVVFTVVMAVVAIGFLESVVAEWRRYPLATYTTITFVVGGLVGLTIRMF